MRMRRRLWTLCLVMVAETLADLAGLLDEVGSEAEAARPAGPAPGGRRVDRHGRGIRPRATARRRGAAVVAAHPDGAHADFPPNYFLNLWPA